MTLFRALAFVAFVIGAILAIVFGSLREPIFWVCSGLAALTLSGAPFDRTL